MGDMNLHKSLIEKTSTGEQGSLHSSVCKQFNENTPNKKVSFKDRTAMVRTNFS